jgi:radical SAM-linked protein
VLKQRFRIKFSKHGDLRFISHHDVMRLFQRALRRAVIEVRMSQGFNPHPKMAFVLPPGVGIESDCEILFLDTSRWYRATELCERLEAELPHGIELLEVTLVSPRSSAVPRDVAYVAALPESRGKDMEGITEKVESFLQSRSVEIDRIRRDKVSRIDLRPYVSALEVTPEGLEMHIRVTPKGAARPDEILRALGVDALAARIRRTELNLNP